MQSTVRTPLFRHVEWMMPGAAYAVYRRILTPRAPPPREQKSVHPGPGSGYLCPGQASSSMVLVAASNIKAHALCIRSASLQRLRGDALRIRFYLPLHAQVPPIHLFLRPLKPLPMPVCRLMRVLRRR